MKEANYQPRRIRNNLPFALGVVPEAGAAIDVLINGSSLRTAALIFLGGLPQAYWGIRERKEQGIVTDYSHALERYGSAQKVPESLQKKMNKVIDKRYKTI